ncbi:12345_t:CDS:2, partial [Acaulospora morrowiae]
YLQNSPLDIYNRTAEKPILLPSRWNFADRGEGVSVERNQLGIGYRSDHPIIRETGIFYYEVDIIDSGPRRKTGYLNRQPGMDHKTIGYQGDDGFVFLEAGLGGNPYGPLYCS